MPIAHTVEAKVLVDKTSRQDWQHVGEISVPRSRSTPWSPVMTYAQLSQSDDLIAVRLFDLATTLADMSRNQRQHGQDL
jgi:hypothetical protein